jgi:excisionase family DNA binding protein
VAAIDERRKRASIESLYALLGRHDVEVTERLIDALDTMDAPDAVDAGLWGAAPTEAQYMEAAGRSVALEERRRQQVLADALNRRQAAERLGISPQAIANKIEAGRLLALRVGREWRLPAWQFDADARDGVVPGLELLIAAYPGGAVSLSVWAGRPEPNLDGEPPLAALRDGRAEEVARLASSLDAAGW